MKKQGLQIILVDYIFQFMICIRFRPSMLEGSVCLCYWNCITEIHEHSDLPLLLEVDNMADPLLKNKVMSWSGH
jgi:hypothetical protein